MAKPAPGCMEISLRNVAQLFNSMDPAPFYERDLDTHAEQFLVSWAQEFPAGTELELLVHLRDEAPAADTAQWIRSGLQHYFAERERLTSAQLQLLLQQGRTSLMVGLGFLAVCLSLGGLLKGTAPGSLGHLAYESLTIAGWVAMWKPLQTYLYDWWPVKQQIGLYRRLQAMSVRLQAGSAIPAG